MDSAKTGRWIIPLKEFGRIRVKMLELHIYDDKLFLTQIDHCTITSHTLIFMTVSISCMTVFIPNQEVGSAPSEY